MTDSVAIIERIYRPVLDTRFIEEAINQEILTRPNEGNDLQTVDRLYHFGQYEAPAKPSQAMIISGDANIRDLFNTSLPSFEQPTKVATTRLNIVSKAGGKPRPGQPYPFDVYLGTAKGSVIDSERTALKQVEGIGDKRQWHRDVLLGRTMLTSAANRKTFIDRMMPYIPRELLLGKIAIDYRISSI